LADLIGGRYQVDTTDYNVIGVGGMGTVYLGTDTRTNMRVAIKQLRPEILLDQPEMLARFKREADALGLLNHPHIVKVLDTVEEKPFSYIVMEYVSGGSLRDLLDKQEQLPVKRVLEIALDLSDALIRAHRLKILHRDLKPANILLAEDGSPRLTDFGVARLEDEPGVTRTGTVIGTLNYLSPEALNGFELDERSDIWAFGVVLYEMLAGHLPFEANTMTSLITTILTKEPPDLDEFRDDVPPTLAVLIDRMLRKDRDERIDSMRQIGAELERIIQNKPSKLDDTGVVSVTWSGELASGESADKSTDDLATEVYPITPQVFDRSTGTLTAASQSNTYQLQKESVKPSQQGLGRWLAILGIVLIVGVVAVVALVLNSTNTSNTPSTTITTEDWEYPVVVGNFENLSGTDTVDVSRFIINDLRENFERQWLYSNIRIINAETAVTSESQALSLAQTYEAPLVIWGTYNNERVDVVIQVGSLDRFADMPFDRNLLERSINVQLRLSSANEQSISAYVAGALAILTAADGDVYEWARLMAVIDDLQVPMIATERETSAQHIYNFMGSYHDASDDALSEIDIAIGSDPNNALLYWLRAMQFNRQQIIEHILTGGEGANINQLFVEMQRNQETAQRLAPETWVAPLYSQFIGENEGGTRSSIGIANSDEDILRVVELRPDLWAPLYIASEIANENDNHDDARTYIEQALALNPDVSLPYTSAIMHDLRDGDIVAANQRIQTIVERLSDPLTTSKMFDTLLGVPTPEGAFPTIFSNLVIGQYENALGIAQDFLTGETSEGLFGNSNNMLLMASIAQCNLQDFARARFGLNTLVSAESDFMFARLVRADVNLSSAGDERALNDFERIANSEQSTKLAPFVEAVRANTYGCENLFELDTVLEIGQDIASN
jgi:serine/threonine protein kinase/tetratricopeptide (TPR) repeat protein